MSHRELEYASIGIGCVLCDSIDVTVILGFAGIETLSGLIEKRLSNLIGKIRDANVKHQYVKAQALILER